MGKWNHKTNYQQDAGTADAAVLSQRVKTYMEKEDYDGVLNTVASMVEAGIQEGSAFYAAAYSYFMNGDYERATSWIDNTLRLAPDHMEARLLLARICLLEDRTADGLAIFDFVLQHGAGRLSAKEKDEIKESLDYYATTEAEEIRANYPHIAALFQLSPAEESQTANFQPLVAPQVQRKQGGTPQVQVQPLQQAPQVQKAQPVEEDAQTVAVRLEQEVLAKDISLAEKIRLLNSFAGGFFVGNDLAAAKLLLKKALELDAHHAATLCNMGYVLAAMGEKDKALELAAMMQIPDFGLLAALRV